MFSLIITIISIALVTALALATIYYGGSAFRQGSDAAKAAQYINEGQQLAGAVAVYEGAGNLTAALGVTQSSLVTAKGLASNISDYSDASSATRRMFLSSNTLITDLVCTQINVKATGTATPAKFASLVALTAATVQYGCYGSAADENSIGFKF